jgi:cytochrome oxidase Cu insertion factor (SCO1/SenC/PrrC family)
MGKRKLAKAPSKKEQVQGKSHRTAWVFLGVLAVALAGIVGFMVYQGGSGVTASSGALARAGSPAPDFTLRLFSGQDITLSGLRGKPVLMDFWASG